jgi:hypothetical protein
MESVVVVGTIKEGKPIGLERRNKRAAKESS